MCPESKTKTPAELPNGLVCQKSLAQYVCNAESLRSLDQAPLRSSSDWSWYINHPQPLLLPRYYTLLALLRAPKNDEAT